MSLTLHFISTSNIHSPFLSISRFTQFLLDIMKLPAAVGERHTFNVKEETRTMIFSEGSKVTNENTAAGHVTASSPLIGFRSPSTSSSRP